MNGLPRIGYRSLGLLHGLHIRTPATASVAHLRLAGSNSQQPPALLLPLLLSPRRCAAAAGVELRHRRLRVGCRLATDSPEPQPPANQQPQQQQQPVAKQRESLATRVWHEIVHYWTGLRLLLFETRVATRIALKYARGLPISRRERRHFARTVADIFRMVPFVFFIVVPFMELLLPLYLKFMPFMLPSTFQQEDKEAEKLRLRLKAKLETAKFLQETLAQGFRLPSGDSEAKETVEEFRRFVEKCSTAGRYATIDELRKYSRLFADELTLDHLERPQLLAICKLLDLPAVGSRAMVALQLEIRLRQLRADDRVIQAEGLDRLNVAELQAACRARGMRSLGLSEERLRLQLAQWLEMHLSQQVPASLLLLSRSLHFPSSMPPEDQLRKAIGSLSQQTVASAEATSAGADNKVRLQAARAADRAIAAEALEPPPEPGQSIGSDELRQLGSAIGSVSAKALDHQELTDLKAGLLAAEEPRAAEAKPTPAQLLRGEVGRLVSEIDVMLGKVSEERDAIRQQIRQAAGDQQQEQEQQEQLLLSLDDLLLALRRFQQEPDDDKWEKILRLLDEDNDGKIELHHVTKVTELLGSGTARLTSSELAELLEALDKEQLVSQKERSEAK